ncbi:MAG: hypothetical protein IKH82_02725 [Clostridiales bacterium]|nr:hypothetical protein [Clostridiales bacterium]
MKTTKIISSVLAASLLMSVSGCSLFDNDDKNVLLAAKAYADGIISGDSADIAECLVDGDDVEEDIEDFLASYDKCEDAYAAIFDSMSYEIDEKSVVSSKKNAEASVDITYTMVDYETVYEDVTEDGGKYEDFVEALEDNDGEDTIEITQTITFVLEGKEWLVKDKKSKNFYEFYEFYDIVDGFKWGAAFEAITVEYFEQVLEDTLGYTCSEFYEDLYWTAQYAGSDMKIDIFQQYDLSHASEVFQRSYTDRFADVLAQGGFDGDYAYEFNGTDGYVVLDGYIDYDEGWFNHNGYIYGGLYFTGDVFVIVLAYTSSSSAHAEVDEFLKAIGYPVPADLF